MKHLIDDEGKGEDDKIIGGCLACIDVVELLLPVDLT